MRRLLLLIVPGVAIVCISTERSQAITFGIQPSIQNISADDSLIVELTTSDLDNYSAPSFSVFDLDITFDNSILNVYQLLFGNELDFGIPEFSFQEVDRVITQSTVSSFEISFTSEFIGAFQPDAMTLAILEFDALWAETTALNPKMIVLGDAIKRPQVSRFVTRSIVTISEDVQPIPFPGFSFIPSSLTAVLVGLGLKHKMVK